MNTVETYCGTAWSMHNGGDTPYLYTVVEVLNTYGDPLFLILNEDGQETTYTFTLSEATRVVASLQNYVTWGS